MFSPPMQVRVCSPLPEIKLVEVSGVTEVDTDEFRVEADCTDVKASLFTVFEDVCLRTSLD